MTKSVLFIGNRVGILNVLQREPDIKVVAIWAVQDSFLARDLEKRAISHKVFQPENKIEVIKAVAETDFDILVSNGCPLILPISKLQKKDRLFINTHPAYLPYLKGFHPINGVFFYQFKFFGATTHYMVDGVDAGNVLAQKKVALTPDIDLGLLYRLSFQLEVDVSSTALKTLKQTHYKYPGVAQPHLDSFYTRKAEHQQIDFTTMLTRDIVIRIKAFGIASQGCKTVVDHRSLVIFEAMKCTNAYLLKQFIQTQPGNIVLEYENKLLVKTTDGLVKITRYEEYKT